MRTYVVKYAHSRLPRSRVSHLLQPHTTNAIKCDWISVSRSNRTTFGKPVSYTPTTPEFRQHRPTTIPAKLIRNAFFFNLSPAKDFKDTINNTTNSLTSCNNNERCRSNRKEKHLFFAVLWILSALVSAHERLSEKSFPPRQPAPATAGQFCVKGCRDSSSLTVSLQVARTDITQRLLGADPDMCDWNYDWSVPGPVCRSACQSNAQRGVTQWLRQRNEYL